MGDNGGQGYLTTPRIAIIDPTSAQVLETVVDSNGRITSIELLSGGLGYDDVPSVYTHYHWLRLQHLCQSV